MMMMNNVVVKEMNKASSMDGQSGLNLVDMCCFTVSDRDRCTVRVYTSTMMVNAENIPMKMIKKKTIEK